MTAPALSKAIAKSGVRWLRELRHIPDSLAHHRRRAAARTLVSTLKLQRVLFVCHGNICRSPFAALLCEQLLPGELSRKIEVGSAGFIGPDRSSPLKAIIAACKYGLDLSQHRSRVVTSELLRSVDLVVVMSAEQAQGIRRRIRLQSIPVLVLGDLDPLPLDRRTILDPWNGSDAAFDESYARISRCMSELVRVLSDGSVGARNLTEFEAAHRPFEYPAEQQA